MCRCVGFRPYLDISANLVSAAERIRSGSVITPDRFLLRVAIGIPRRGFSQRRADDAVLNRKSLIASFAMELQISMIPSPEDPPWRSDDYQSELRKLDLALRGDGLEIREVGSHPARSGETSPISGEWRVELGATLEPILKAPVGSWLQARRGRTARLRIGEIEADVRTAEELSRVIKIANCYQEVTENES